RLARHERVAEVTGGRQRDAQVVVVAPLRGEDDRLAELRRRRRGVAEQEVVALLVERLGALLRRGLRVRGASGTERDQQRGGRDGQDEGRAVPEEHGDLPTTTAWKTDVPRRR